MSKLTAKAAKITAKIAELSFLRALRLEAAPYLTTEGTENGTENTGMAVVTFS